MHAEDAAPEAAAAGGAGAPARTSTHPAVKAARSRTRAVQAALLQAAPPAAPPEGSAFDASGRQGGTVAGYQRPASPSSSQAIGTVAAHRAAVAEHEHAMPAQTAAHQERLHASSAAAMAELQLKRQLNGAAETALAEARARTAARQSSDSLGRAQSPPSPRLLAAAQPLGASPGSPAEAEAVCHYMIQPLV
jgi:hypothetical protein